MFSNKEQLETTVDCLVYRICELNMEIRALENKNKSFDEVLKNYQDEKSKNRELEEKIFNYEMEIGRLKKENKELEEKVETKAEIKKMIHNLSAEGGKNAEKR